MNGEQLALDFGEQLGRDPFTCEHALRVSGRYTVCGKSGTEVYTNCRASVCGDPPRCVHEKPDNSPAAMERRRAWLKKNGGKCENGFKAR